MIFKFKAELDPGVCMIGGEVTMVIREDGVFTLEPIGGLLVFEEGRFVIVVVDGEGAFVVVIVPNGSGCCWKGNRVVDGARVSITVERVVVFIGLYVVGAGAVVGGETVVVGGGAVNGIYVVVVVGGGAVVNGEMVDGG
jgi:hypothetical protein